MSGFLSCFAFGLSIVFAIVMVSVFFGFWCMPMERWKEVCREHGSGATGLVALSFVGLPLSAALIYVQWGWWL